MTPSYRWAVLFLPLLMTGCGAGGSDGGNSGGVSGKVPYLVSTPTINTAASTIASGSYDVTVTVEADGPTGVADVSLWIMDDVGSNSTPLTLTQIPGTKRWSAATYYLLPLPPGKYHLDSIQLHDGDPFTADPLRSGWYFVNSLFSNNKYTVDEREIAGGNFAFYNVGLSAIPVVRFTLAAPTP